VTLRYFGGKKAAAKHIAPVLRPCRELREPYFGSGAVTLWALGLPGVLPEKVWINDLDDGIAALWTAVIREPEKLIALVEAFTPTVAAFVEFKASLLDASYEMPGVERGFRKLAVHQMSYSGLGTMSGSPIGGLTQGPDNPKDYEVGARWNPAGIVPHLLDAHTRLRGRAHEDCCTSYDALDVIRAPGEDVVLYVDPPYVKAGKTVYQVRYTSDQQHRDLATVLAASPHRWLLSYDDHPLVRELYAKFQIEEAEWAYTAHSKKGKIGAELLILNQVPTPRALLREEDAISALFESDPG